MRVLSVRVSQCPRRLSRYSRRSPRAQLLVRDQIPGGGPINSIGRDLLVELERAVRRGVLYGRNLEHHKKKNIREGLMFSFLLTLCLVVGVGYGKGEGVRREKEEFAARLQQVVRSRSPVDTVVTAMPCNMRCEIRYIDRTDPDTPAYYECDGGRQGLSTNLYRDLPSCPASRGLKLARSE